VVSKKDVDGRTIGAKQSVVASPWCNVGPALVRAIGGLAGRMFCICANAPEPMKNVGRDLVMIPAPARTRPQHWPQLRWMGLYNG
jgi:hypothetical protein